MSEKIVFGALRIIRLFVGLYMGGAAIGVLGGLLMLFGLYQDASILVIFLLRVLNFAISLAAFEGLRQLIHKMHRASFGKPHPDLLKILSL